MKYYFTLCLIIFMSPFNLSQNRIGANIGYGYFLTNSENSLKTIGDKNFKSHIIYGLEYLRENVLGVDVLFEYSYTNSIEEKTLEFFTYGGGIEPAIPFWSDVSQVIHSFDLDIYYKINNYISVAVGPSLAIMNRLIEVNPPQSFESKSPWIYDKLASTGLGGNTFIELSYPLNDGENYFSLDSKLKIRYVHSIWFDEKGRNLDNYKQEFLDTQISIGVGYSF